MVLTMPARPSFSIRARHKNWVVVSASYCRSGRWHGRTSEALALHRYYSNSHNRAIYFLGYEVMSINRKSINKRWNPFQKSVLIGLVILGGIVLGLVLFMFLYTRYEVWAIKNPARFRHEVGYQLPENTQIIYTEARVFSLADGPNYTWFVTSESSLRAWAEGPGQSRYTRFS